MEGTRATGFEETWTQASTVGGWLKEPQARMLWQAVDRLPAGALVVEIGSHQGRSTVVLGRAAAARGARVVAVDPFVEGRMFGGRSTRQLFEQNIAEAGLDATVSLVAQYSTRLRPAWDEPIDLLYVDGKHDYWTCRDDLLWARHLTPGGQVLVHDAFSSVGVTSAILVDVLLLGRLRYLGRSTSMALFDRERPRLSDRVRVLRQLPWFARNVAVKVLLRLRLAPLTRLLGHHEPCDPY